MCGVTRPNSCLNLSPAQAVKEAFSNGNVLGNHLMRETIKARALKNNLNMQNSNICCY